MGQSRHLLITEGNHAPPPELGTPHPLGPPPPAYLRGNISKVYVLLQVTHHHEVPGLGPVVVQGVVVDVTQNSTDADPAKHRYGKGFVAKHIYGKGFSSCKTQIWYRGL